MDEHIAEMEQRRPRYLEYQKLVGTFKPGDNIPALLNQLEQMWFEDSITLNDRAAIFLQCVGKYIRDIIRSITEDRVGNYQS